MQQSVVADILATFPQLCDSDVVSTPMGSRGEDVRFSAAARDAIPYSIECKNVERINIWTAMAQAIHNAKGYAPLVVLKRNHETRLCLLQWHTFLGLLQTKKQVVDSSTQTDDEEWLVVP